MTDHDDALYLTYITEAAARIERSAAARGRGALREDEELRDATIYRLQAVAESTQRLSPELKTAPRLPRDRPRHRLGHHRARPAELGSGSAS